MIYIFSLLHLSSYNLHQNYDKNIYWLDYWYEINIFHWKLDTDSDNSILRRLKISAFVFFGFNCENIWYEDMNYNKDFSFISSLLRFLKL
jgi:hypothetical protein